MPQERLEWSPEELYERLAHENALCLLDVRPGNACGSSTIQTPYSGPVTKLSYEAFETDEREALHHLPFDREQEIVVFCGKGLNSLKVTERLLRHGYRARGLQGGITAWSQHLAKLSGEEG